MAYTEGLSTEESRIEHAANEARRVLRREEDLREERLPEARTQLLRGLRRATLEAPLHSLLIAFLVGFMIARRR